jgi:phage terminase Nu1 subunit (DNA packaging protein)
VIDRETDFAELLGGGESQSVSPRPKPLEAEKIRLARAQAEKVEIQNATSRGELIPAGDIEREWASIVRDLRATLLALPSRIQQRLPHLSARDIAAIDGEIRHAMTDIANGKTTGGGG